MNGDPIVVAIDVTAIPGMNTGRLVVLTERAARALIQEVEDLSERIIDPAAAAALALFAEQLAKAVGP